jgi:hypothetical protein
VRFPLHLFPCGYIKNAAILPVDSPILNLVPEIRAAVLIFKNYINNGKDLIK